MGRRAGTFGSFTTSHFASNWILTLIQLSRFKDRQNDHEKCLSNGVSGAPPADLLERVLTFRVQQGAPTDLLENALTFRVQQGAPTDLLDVRFVFALE